MARSQERAVHVHPSSPTAWEPAKCQAAQAHTDKNSPRALLERRGREALGEHHKGGRGAQQRRHFRGLRRELELDVIWAGPRTAGRIWGPGAAGRMTPGDRVPFTKAESGEAGGARPG